MTCTRFGESRFPSDAADEGLEVTRAIWADMRSFGGYLDHEIVQDLNDTGHLFVISRWAS
jgi:heme-degrading monooxygenase HmoA